MAAVFAPVSTTEEILKSEPWKQPWWHAGKRDIAILGWVLLIHITAAIGLVLYPIPGWPVFLGALALVFLGGLGTTRDTVVERIFRDIRAFRIYDGPSEVHRWSLARHVQRA